MNKEEFKNYFWNMPAMKYYEPDLNKPKAQEMITNKDGNYLAMQKWDGEWNMAIILDNEEIMRGRNKGVSGDYKDRAESLPHITAELLSLYPSGTVLLGELAFDAPSKTAKDVGTIMRCLPKKAIERQKNTPLIFKVFDCLAFNWEDIHNLPVIERLDSKYRYPFLYLGKEFNMKYVDILDYYEFENGFLDMAEEIWSCGGEGGIIVKADEQCRPGERKAWTSLKLKKILGNSKGKVIDFLEPNKNYEGSEIDNWQYFIDGIPVTKPYYYGWKNGVLIENEGNLIRVTSGLDDATREWLATEEAAKLKNNRELYAEITGMEITNDSIRHPVFLKILK